MQYKFLDALVDAFQGAKISDQEISQELAKISVLSAPELSGHVYGSDFSFVISSFLKSKGVMINPQALADSLASQIKNFDVDVPGSGHINASPSDCMIEFFQKTLFEQGDEFLLDGRAKTQNLYKEMLRNISKQTKKSKNEDITLIKESDNPELQLMTIALLSDEDLDSSVYLKGLEGKENIPWFFCQFNRDVLKVVNQCSGCDPQCLMINREQVLLGAYNFTRRMPVSVEEICRGFILELFSFRHTLRLSVNRARPDIWFLYLRSLIGRFYAFYNVPKYRELSELTKKESLFLGTLGHVLSVVSSAVEDFQKKI